MNTQWLVTPLLALTMILTGCSKNSEMSKSRDSGFSIGSWFGQKPQAAENILKVTDLNGQPLADAQILIGNSLNDPFNGNFVTTDADGIFIAPTEWTTPQVVTVAAQGFVRASFFAQVPEGQTFELRRTKPPAQYELKGKGIGFQIKDSDNLLDFALMVPAVERGELFSFNMQMFISPQMDTVDVYGQKVSLPSNVSVPRQRENYGFVPVTLEKSNYRMYFDSMGMKRVMTVRGQFPFKQVVNELQNNKPFIELINHFSLKGGSLKDIPIGAPTQVHDLPVNELVFNTSRSFQTPAFQNDEFLLAVALSPYQNDFIPTDFKNVPANTNFNMVTAAGATPHLLVALKKKAEQNEFGGGKLSAALVPFHSGFKPELLPLIEKPEVLNLTEVRMGSRLPIQSVKPLATYLLLSEVTRRGAEPEAIETSNRLWEVYAQGWQYEMKLPQWPGETIIPGSKRWEVTYLGTEMAGNKAVDLSPRILETVTHATHSATDF